MQNKNQSSNENLLAGIKGVLELLENSPEQLEHVFLRKDKSGPPMPKIMDLCRKNGVRYTLLEKAGLDRMYNGNHQGVLGRLALTPSTALETLLEIGRHSPLPLILALDQIQDPGNVGTLARTLYALGGGGIILPKHNTAYLGADALRASAGALPLLTVSRVTNLSRALEEAANAGFTIFTAESAGVEAHEAGGQNIHTACLSLPAVLVLGNEQKGIRPGVLKHASSPLYIPFRRDFDSLNVAQAGAIFMAAFSKLA